MAKRRKKREKKTPPKVAPTARGRLWLRRGLAVVLGLGGSGLAVVSCYQVYLVYVLGRLSAAVGGQMKLKLTVGPLFHFGSAAGAVWIQGVLMVCLLLCSVTMVVAAVKLFRMREFAFVGVRRWLAVFVAGLLIAGVLVAATFKWSLKGRADAYVVVRGNAASPALAQSSESDSCGYATSSKGLRFTAFSMDQLAEFLSSHLGVPVRNGTGLQGLYSFEIECMDRDIDTIGMGLREFGIQLIPDAPK